MKKGTILFLLFSPFLFLSFVLPAKKRDNTRPHLLSDTSFNLLAAYGEYVFGREGCIRCHVLVENTMPGKISLDGLNGKYSSEWHYMHLKDPMVMVPDSRMPAFKKLANRDIDIQKLTDIYQHKTGEIIPPGSKKISQLIKDSADLFLEGFNGLGEDFDKTDFSRKEIMALIIWLQQIKSSPTKQVHDSIRNDAVNRMYANRIFQWKAWLQDNKSTFYATANSTKKEVVSKGETIFKLHCATCHRDQAQGSIGPNLTDDYWLNGNSIEQMANTIRFGKNAMPPWEQVLSPEEISLLIAYIRSLKDSHPPDPKVPQGVLIKN